MMTVARIDRLRAFIRSHLGLVQGGNIRCKIGITPFSGQTWRYMCGYIQKDRRFSHHQFWQIGISYAELIAGRADYDTVSSGVVCLGSGAFACFCPCLMPNQRVCNLPCYLSPSPTSADG